MRAFVVAVGLGLLASCAPRPPAPDSSATDTHSVLLDLKVYLNRDFFSQSPLKVTPKEAERAHARLMALNDARFDHALAFLARDSNPYSNADDFIGNFIEALGGEQPALLDSLVARMTKVANPSNTGPAVARQVRGEAWAHLSAAIERLPAEAGAGPTRIGAFKALGGGDTIGLKFAFEYCDALLEEELEQAARIATYAADVQRLAGELMPAHVARIAGHDVAATERLGRLFAEGDDPRTALRRGQPDSVAEFKRVVARELDLTPRAADLLLAGLMVAYR